MMRFVIRSTQSGGCRCATMTEFSRHPETVIETPACLMYSRGGSPPHLTPDIWEKLSYLPSVVQMPLPSLVEYHENIQKFKNGLGSFCSLPNSVIFTTTQDSGKGFLKGYNDSSSVAVWGKSGKYRLEVDHFMKIQEIFQPDIYQALSDADTPQDSSIKRIRKSVDRSLLFLDVCLEKHSDSEVLKKSAIFGAIEGGYHLPERLRSARETSSRAVDGFSIEGFTNFGSVTADFDFCKVKEVLDQTMAVLPSDKPRFLQGVWNPDQILEAVSSGIDLFDSSYPYMATESGEAILFDFKYDQGETTHTQNLDTRFTIDLKDKRYRDDFTPVSVTCRCYCCQTFTRAYINHLLNTSELLASVLLMIHNFHHYFEFFHTIRKSLEEDKFEHLRRYIQEQSDNIHIKAELTDR